MSERLTAEELAGMLLFFLFGTFELILTIGVLSLVINKVVEIFQTFSSRKDPAVHDEDGPDMDKMKN